ncbi:MAG TPA: PKD domain-containing protein [Candidatus Paceibacterota bacterium]|nr:PKD domain-containing protein [Candidatus Paceibacterota bacterium]
MIDVKKLITGFLILAAAASVSAVLVMNIGGSGSVAGTDSSGTLAANGQAGSQESQSPTQTPLQNQNAFLPAVAVANGVEVISDDVPTTSISLSDDSNLTNALAETYLDGVISANPNGATPDANGNPNLAQPDINAIAMQVANATATAGLQIPDWTLEANMQPIRIATSSSGDDIAQYGKALNDVLTKHFVSTNLSEAVDSLGTDPGQMAAINTQIQGSLGDVLALRVPSQLADFHKSLVMMLVYEKNSLQLAEGANADPVKTGIIFKEEQAKYQAALQNLQLQMQKASQVGLYFGKNSNEDVSASISFVDNILGIHTAHAIFGLGDITFDPSVFAEIVLQHVNDIILQILKNALTALVQQHVLKWIQGSGAPRFVQQWGVALVQSYTQGALNYLNSNFACVNPSILPQIQVTLSTFYNVNAGNNYCAGTFTAALGGYSLSQFYQNFSNGGWLAFGVNALPVNNYYQSLYFQAQIADQNARNAQLAATTQLTSSQGFTGDGVCADGSDPKSGYHLECRTPSGANAYPNGGSCNAGDTPVYVSNGGSCADGSEPKTTTPGITTGYSLSSILDSPIKLITSADDIAGLLNALTDSLLNSLSSLAVNTATQAINSGLSGTNPSSIQSGGATAPVIPLSCNPTAQNTSSSVSIFVSANGGKSGANGTVNYSWASSDGSTATGYVFSHAFVAPGTYTVTLSDTTGDTPATCTVIVTQ